MRKRDIATGIARNTKVEVQGPFSWIAVELQLGFSLKWRHW